MTKKYVDNFINKYELSKTLCFELKPIGNTQALFDGVAAQEGNNPIVADEIRKAKTEEIRLLLDDYYRDFISAVLTKIDIAEDTTGLYLLYCAHTDAPKDKPAAEACEKAQTTLRKKIAEAFKKETSDWGLDKYSDLWGTSKKAGKLYEWNYRRLNYGIINVMQFSRTEKLLDEFKGFLTYFANYKAVRDSLFSAEDSPSAIAYRIVNINAEKYFENALRLKHIQAYPELSVALGEAAQGLLEPANFSSCLTQTGIDAYNKNEADINSTIAKYRQTSDLLRSELPLLEPLYKQLLSESDREFIKELHTDKEMLELAAESIEKARKYAISLSGLVKDAPLKTTYIRADRLTDISQELYGRWREIPAALESIGCDTKKNPTISLSTLQGALTEVTRLAEGRGEKIKQAHIADYFQNLDCYERLKTTHTAALEILKLEKLDKNRRVPSAEYPDGGLGYRQIAKIRLMMDAIVDLIHFYKPFYLQFKGKKTEAPQDIDAEFYSAFMEIFVPLNDLITNYNLIRNYATKKPYSRDKFKLNFDNAQLLRGWDISQLESARGTLLSKDGKYYLILLTDEGKRLFSGTKTEYDCNDKEPHYRRMLYKQLTGSFMALPKTAFSASGADLYAPSDEIKQIRAAGLFKKSANNPEALGKMIDFYKSVIRKHPEWNKYFTFNFRATEEYADISEFFKDVDAATYSVAFENIRETYINKAVSEGTAYLFEIYCRKFSDKANGRFTKHENIFKMLFEEKNLDNISDTSKTFCKLNGGAEMFFRRRSLTYDRPTHPAGVPIKNKNPLAKKETRTLQYDLIKDKRFTVDKMFLHLPFTLCSRAQGRTMGFNADFNKVLRYCNDVNIIGVSRGERDLLYYVIIDNAGNIIKQASMNVITAPNGNITDYRSLLTTREAERDKARKDWGTIDKIADLKHGYLGNVVYQLSKLMIDYNAVLVLEDLDLGFKSSRVAIEKAVYQQFERAMIQKLGYLTFKDAEKDENGSCYKAYQLAAPFESFSSIYGQSGAIYYVSPAYTTAIDPATGFIPLLKVRYKNIKAAQSTLESFSRIAYNPTKKYFEFDIKFEDPERDWTICSGGGTRHWWNNQTSKYEEIDVTARLKELFEKFRIMRQDNSDLKTDILEASDASFYKELFFCLQLLLSMRYYSSEKGRAAEYLLSPVVGADGTQFDSRTVKENMPLNVSANCAYHVALKGLRMIKSIDEDGKINYKELKNWAEYIQEKRSSML